MKTSALDGMIIFAMPAKPALSALSERVDMPQERLIELAGENADGPVSLGVAIQALELMHDDLVDEMERLDPEGDGEEDRTSVDAATASEEEQVAQRPQSIAEEDDYETEEGRAVRSPARGKLALVAGAAGATAAAAALCCAAMRLHR